MNQSKSNLGKRLLVAGLLLVTGLVVYSSVGTGPQDKTANQKQETAEDKNKEKEKKRLPDFLTPRSQTQSS